MHPNFLRFVVLILLTHCARADNLVANPDFSDGFKGWIVHFPEENEQNYSRNHEWIEIAPGPEGKDKAIHFTLSAAVAASEGVKAVTPLMKIEDLPGKAYEFGAEVYSDNPSLILFIEGYQRDPEQQEKGNDHYPGFARSYRATIHVKIPRNQWGQAKRVITLPTQDRYRPSHMLIKLYAFHPAGNAWFRNVYLRPVDNK